MPIFLDSAYKWNTLESEKRLGRRKNFQSLEEKTRGSKNRSYVCIFRK